LFVAVRHLCLILIFAGKVAWSHVSKNKETMLMDKPVSKFTGKNSVVSVFHLKSHKKSEVSKSVFVFSLDQKGTFSLKTVAFNRRKK
jgi:hypothetical protein